MEEILLSFSLKGVLICSTQHLRYMNLRRHREIIATTILVVFIIVLYLLITWGVVVLSEAVAAIVAVLFTSILTFLGWAFKPRATMWLRESTHQKESVAMGEHVRQKDELEKLITPLYLSLDSNRDNPIKGAHFAFEDIKLYGNLAQPELRNLLHQYCDIRDEWENTKPEDQAPTFQLYHQRDLEDTVNQIYDLTKQRYEELMWGKRER
jgi:hypothetical protein